jgi:hypothetical protein
MGLFDDISYGLGISKDKPAGYDQRTADSIEATRGRDEADRYREGKGISRAPTGRDVRPPVRPGTAIPRYPGSTSPYYDAMKDRSYGTQGFFNMFTGNEMGIDPELAKLNEKDPKRLAAEAELDTYLYRTREAGDRARNNFMGTGLTQQEYARGQQYGFSTGSDGQMTARTSDRGPAPTITDPNAPDATDPESTIFNPNNAFLRERMRMQQEQGGGIMPPAGAEPPITGGPAIPPPQMPMLPPYRPMPNMPPQLRGIMGLADRSNISPAMRYAAENYYRLGGRQMMNDEYERGRGMIQGQSV